MIEDVYIRLVGRMTRTPALADVKSLLQEMELLREEVLNALETREKAQNISTNDAHSSGTNRIQIPNLPMNLNPAPKRHRWHVFTIHGYWGKRLRGKRKWSTPRVVLCPT